MTNPNPSPNTRYGKPGGNKRGRGMIGSDPATLRLKMRNALAKRIDILTAIAGGELTTTQRGVDKEGKAWEIEVEPTIDERRKAVDTLAKYGVGTQIQADVTTGGQTLSALLALPPEVDAPTA